MRNLRNDREISVLEKADEETATYRNIPVLEVAGEPSLVS
jgi:hypothetical protein